MAANLFNVIIKFLTIFFIQYPEVIGRIFLQSILRKSLIILRSSKSSVSLYALVLFICNKQFPFPVI